MTGIKPTYGTVSRYGLIAYGSSLDQIGPIAKDVTDCATILEAIASYDTKDSTSGEFTCERVGDMDTEMVREFFYAVSYSAAMNLHIKVLTPGNNHHMIEAMFKAFAKALDDACTYDSRIKDVMSTKGSL